MSQTDDVYQGSVLSMVDMFISWMSQFENQSHFHSAQKAYECWLEDYGHGLLEGNYSDAVAVMLVFLSRCIANPGSRRYLSNPDTETIEYTILQVMAPEEDDEVTYWEFFTEANFRKSYAEWLEHHPR
jgi:hypothetical protein